MRNGQPKGLVEGEAVAGVVGEGGFDAVEIFCRETNDRNAFCGEAGGGLAAVAGLEDESRA